MYKPIQPQARSAKCQFNVKPTLVCANSAMNRSGGRPDASRSKISGFPRPPKITGNANRYLQRRLKLATLAACHAPHATPLAASLSRSQSLNGKMNLFRTEQDYLAFENVLLLAQQRRSNPHSWLVHHVQSLAPGGLAGDRRAIDRVHADADVDARTAVETCSQRGGPGTSLSGSIQKLSRAGRPAMPPTQFCTFQHTPAATRCVHISQQKCNRCRLFLHGKAFESTLIKMSQAHRVVSMFPPLWCVNVSIRMNAVNAVCLRQTTRCQ